MAPFEASESRTGAQAAPAVMPDAIRSIAGPDTAGADRGRQRRRSSGPRAEPRPASTAGLNAVAIVADAPDGVSELGGEPVTRLSLGTRVANLVAVVLPFLALIAAIILFWDTRFSWLNFGMLLGGYLLTAIGVTIGYHRLFTHKSFKTNRVVTAILGVLGSMAVEGPIIQWVATHRCHHQHTDRPDDPHSPHVGGAGLGGWLRGVYHAHFGWFFTPAPTRAQRAHYVPDLLADPLIRSLSRLFLFWAVLGLLIPAVVAFAVTGTWLGALLGLIWGGLVRVFFVHHATWSVNSVCHLWGRQPFNTHDDSRNNAIIGILALGEGWHNNHHAFPASARQGLEWWQIDVSYLLIRALALAGLASDIRLPPADRVAAKRVRG